MSSNRIIKKKFIQILQMVGMKTEIIPKTTMNIIAPVTGFVLFGSFRVANMISNGNVVAPEILTRLAHNDLKNSN